ncbi:hypothetical protein RSK20926_11879 [Roseobacter sp. SK209-2-6]|uniref:hypothetical protein n=1 Tax=Roseobacter sp. SK209-2-6 TaxID=388739 RepID=UPI0000F3C49E|nr:hypothetical protein [Roseobacter sp. SK209-2-6]EBA18417.1 hypothetical protein RSK20926_11879 [Roseobacter sp. SK209-2-6]
MRKATRRNPYTLAEMEEWARELQAEDPERSVSVVGTEKRPYIIILKPPAWLK